MNEPVMVRLGLAVGLSSGEIPVGCERSPHLPHHHQSAAVVGGVHPDACSRIVTLFGPIPRPYLLISRGSGK